MKRNFKITVSYDGTDYVGWQVQPNGVTIQSLLQDAIEKVTSETVSVVGSGRTDAGVHAIGQVANFGLDVWRHPAGDLKRALNRFLPDAIVVREASEVAEDFHAIRSAIAKRYRYQMQIGGDRDPFEYRYRWHVPYQLELAAMRDAASKLVGRHDFQCFQASGSDRRSTVRQIQACEVLEQPCERMGQSHVAVEVQADGFLYNMVRNIVGSLVEVGRGKHPPQWFDWLIESRNRCAAGPTAPPQGLFLLWVDYEAGEPKSSSNLHPAG